VIAASDFFYLSLGIGFLILTGCAVAVSVQLYKILTDVRSVSDNLVDAVSDVVSVKENLKTVMTALVSKLIDKLGEKKGGRSKKEDGE
jgi:hypothetical protein